MQIHKLNCEPLIKSDRKIGIRILNRELFASGYLRDTANILRRLTIDSWIHNKDHDGSHMLI
jgi:hypothetical protein